jgi:hypothetical protein
MGFIFALSVGAIVVSCINVSGLRELNKNVDKRLTTLSREVSAIEEKAVEAGQYPDDALFVVKEYEGQVGVYDIEDGALLEVVNVYTQTLPYNDRRYLEAGVIISSLGELVEIYQDLTS